MKIPGAGSGRMRGRRRSLRFSALLAAGAGLCVLATVALASQIDFRPGFNLFSIAQDVQVGKEGAAQVDRELPLLSDDETARYVSDLGRRLQRFAPDNQPEYVWQFRVIDSTDVNAFALPGGYVFVDRATVELARDEAELAGVLAHEEGHVVLRHGTHQASETLLADMPAQLLAGILGPSESLLNKLAQAGIGMGVNSLLLRNSRAMETEADSVGAYILYQAGYDPHAMAEFFEIIKRKYPQDSGAAANFLADHPDPGNRVQAVDAEIPQLGAPKAWSSDNARFQAVKSHLLSLPPPAPPKPEAQS